MFIYYNYIYILSSNALLYADTLKNSVENALKIQVDLIVTKCKSTSFTRKVSVLCYQFMSVSNYTKSVTKSLAVFLDSRLFFIVDIARLLSH